MSNELDVVLQRELDIINRAEKRDDRPYFDISFIKQYPGLYWSMFFLFIITMAVLVYSDTFGAVEYVVCCAIFVVCNFFFFFHINPSYKVNDIDKGALKNCYTGDWFMERHVRDEFVQELLSNNLLNNKEKQTLNDLYLQKGYVYFADIYRLRH